MSNINEDINNMKDKKLPDVLKTDFSRAFLGWRFPLAVFLMFLAWELNSRRFQVKEDVLYLFIHVWRRSTTSLLAIVITSAAYLASFCEDSENHFLRYAVMRTGVRRYVLSKVITCFCSSFLVLFLGTVLFLVYQSFHLPLTAEESVAVMNFKPMTCLGWMLPEHIVIFLGIQTFLHGLMCGGMCVLALAFSTFIRNSYGVYMIPFLLNYCFYYVFNFFFCYIFTDAPELRPMFNIEEIYDCVITYTENPLRLLSYAVFVTFLFVVTGYEIMYKKLKGEFR